MVMLIQFMPMQVRTANGLTLRALHFGLCNSRLPATIWPLPCGACPVALCCLRPVLVLLCAAGTTCSGRATTS